MSDDLLTDRAQADGPAGAAQQAGMAELPHAGAVAAEQVSLEIRHHIQSMPGKSLKLQTIWYLFTLAALIALASVFIGKAIWGALWVLLLGHAVLYQLTEMLLGRRSHAQRKASGTFASDPAARLKAVGRIDELQLLEKLPDVPFEPMIFRRVTYGPFGALAVSCVLCTLWMCDSMQRGMPSLGGWWFGQLMLLQLSVAVPLFGASYIWYYLSTTYYRVVPGRLDVMKKTLFAIQPCVRLRLDLTKAHVIVEFHKLKVEISPPDGQTLSIWLAGLSDRYEFVRALFQGAACTYPAQALPDDALLG